MRLTLLYGAMFVVSGAGLLGITYALVSGQLPRFAVAKSGRPAVVTTPEAGRFGPGGRAGGAPEAAGALMVADPALARQCRPAAGHVPSQAQIARCIAFGRALVSQQRAAELRQLLAESGVALAIMSVASIGLGWLVAGRALRPLRTITTAARSISANNLHARLALDGPDDEVTELGKTFDSLLARLEGAFAAQRQFVANASHELRTPLARQRTLLEVALADPDSSAAALRHACARVLAAGGEQERLIEALLTLSRSQRGIDRREPVDVAAIAGEAVLAHRAQASALGVTVRTSLGGAKVMGDERLIERLVANLIDNAVRHNVHGGVVGVRTGNTERDADCRASLTVVNSGPVIAPADVDRLFQPFQRAGGRTAAADGLGLGLSIVAAITAAHGARLEASAPPAGGLAISIAFSEGADPA